MTDSEGINWFENSVEATYANYKFCLDNSSTYKTFSETSWGLTACDTPTGYSGLIGAAPSGRMGITYKNDGTVPPCGAIGSLPFTPEIVIPCFEYYSTMLDGDLIGPYGYYDAFNFEKSLWIAKDVIGIDKGIELLMLENYRNEAIWDSFMKLELMDKAIEVLGFTKE